MAEHEVTLGEVYRLISETRKDIRDMRTDLIGRAEYESDQEATAAKFARVDDAIKDWRNTSTAEHVQIRAELKAAKLDAEKATDALRSRMHTAEERGKSQRWAVVLAVIVGGIGLVTGVIGALVQGVIAP